MAFDNEVAESFKKALTTAASIAASAMIARSMINEFLPHQVRDYIFSGIDSLRSRLSSQQSIIIEQTEGYASNLVFDAARTFLSTRINHTTRRLRVSQLHEGKSMELSLEPGEELIDLYEGIQFKWQLLCRQVERSSNDGLHHHRMSSTTELQSFELRFHKKHKDNALNSYLPFILEQAKAIREADRVLQLYTNDGSSETWCAVSLHHPSTFGTLAMDPELKSAVMEDLARFVKRKEYYRRTGKAWKRGYLLYGPPGTGKSSLIAAMANYLRFDIYDLNLSEVYYNSVLRKLLLGMSNRSILVVEDIDCAAQLQKRDEVNESEAGSSSNDPKVTLWGLLNSLDGLWSSSGEERIIVMTTNYRDRLDQALLRPGRMDMHIHMSYCGPHAFRVLASTYHAIDEHQLFGEIEGLIREAEVTPAEVAEELMRSDDTDAALRGLLESLSRKRKEATDAIRRQHDAERPCKKVKVGSD